MKFKVRIAVIIINIVAMLGGLLFISVSVKDRMKLATTLPLEKDKYEEVNTLIDKYIKAKKSEDFKALAECVNNIEDCDKESIKKENAVSNKVNNIHCYTLEGYYDNTYVVFVYQEDVWNDLEVTIPQIKQCYVCEYNGKLVVYSGQVGDSKKTKKIKQYNKATLNNKEVQKLITDVNEDLAKVIKENEKFAKIYYEFMGIQNPNATPSPTPGPDATPVPTVSANPDDAIG